ncbi:uncharacterized protein LOC128920083 [Zeugodacus cucurbitae]|uniref:uncharacterized protein LOC128920083 n=1 Tax=Zeugodacus cucurbitae TaxID=28588 RepID=UPI0023D9533C|nr:uncharacterized protein LOC128920083 [Zeugodacus cucurbitae]
MVPVPTSCSLNVNVSGASSNISSNLVTDGATGTTGRHRRQSSVNVVSWNETVSVQCAPDENTDPAEEPSVEVPVTMREKVLHRRHLSLGNATYPLDEQSILQDGNRRYSNVSWARDAEAQRTKMRPHSWGPVGTAYLDSLMCDAVDTKLHGQCDLEIHIFSLLFHSKHTIFFRIYSNLCKLYIFSEQTCDNRQ